MTKPRMILAAVLACWALATVAVAGTADEVAAARAAWLLGRAEPAGYSPQDTRHFQSDVGLATAPSGGEQPDGVGSTGLRVLASAILPGSGEALSGYMRGYFMMALDIFAWTQVAKYDDEGQDKSDEYYAFADAHYTDEWLVEAYDPAQHRPGAQRRGRHLLPHHRRHQRRVEELGQLPLYVTKEEDRREYYENLGKWDQFIFGWDDYTRASVSHPEHDYEPTRTISDLRQPWVSQNREIYRDMRDDANDAYQTRDRWLYVNIGLRVFWVLQTA